MSKENWLKLYDIFVSEGLEEKHSDVFEVLDLIKKSIELGKEQDEISKKLQELNKED